MKSYHLTQEQALEIASKLELDGCDITTWENGYIEFETKTALQSFANAVLDQVLGEPFGIWHAGETEDESDFYLYEDAGDVSCDKCIKLYAPKEQS